MKPMKLKTLFKDINECQIRGSKETEITGISCNSKCVAPGHLFIAKKGSQLDGNKFIQEALQSGAVAILSDIYNPFLNKVTQIIHQDPALIEAHLASAFYQEPSKSLLTVGVTGTSGKTTTTMLIKHLLDALDKPCGVIGTIEYIVGDNRYKASLTTPDVITNHRLMREMVSLGCKSVAMEVSSHALEQNRVDEIHFDAAIFTNLSLDHLDYHHTMDEYAKAKAKLFSSLKDESKKKLVPHCSVAIVNADSPWHKHMLENCHVDVITYGITEEANVKANIIHLGVDSSSFDVYYKDEKVTFNWSLPGKFNISNCLAVVALGLKLGVPLDQIANIMHTAPCVQGRLEKVSNPLGLNIYVDYAHKDDALKNVLECLRDVKKGKLITVFGCGGNRDKSKRPKMAAVAENLSDIIIVTSDNPRDEDPNKIIEEICAGFIKNSHEVEVDRKIAIEKAIRYAGKDDIILIAGKGHEPYQIFAYKTIEFDDRLVAKEICEGIAK